MNTLNKTTKSPTKPILKQSVLDLVAQVPKGKIISFS